MKKININKNNENIIIVKKDKKETNKSSSIGDMICSLFTSFDSKQDKVNEINSEKKNKKKDIESNRDINKSMLNEAFRSPKCQKIKLKNNSLAYINSKKDLNRLNTEQINKNYTNNIIKDFINNPNSYSNKFLYKCNKNPNILKLKDFPHQYSHSETNINKYIKLNNQGKIHQNQLINTSITANNNFNQTNIIQNTYTNIISNIIFDEFKKEVHYSPTKLKLSTSSSNINTEKVINKNNKMKDIDIHIKNKNNSDLNLDNFSDLNDSRIITPKKGYIFKRINPIKLLGDFKKELSNYTKKKKNLYIKTNIEKK